MSNSNWFVGLMPEEVPFEEIQKKADNGDFHEWNFEVDPFEFTENGYEDVIEKLKEYKAEDYLKYQEKYNTAKKNGDTKTEKEMQDKMEAMVNEVYDIYRSKNIYPITYFSEYGILQEIEKCIAYKAFWSGDTVSCGAGVGTTLCKFLFPNLEDTPSKHDLEKTGAESIYAKFMNEQYLKRAIKFCYSYKNGFPVPTSVEGGLRLVGSAPSNFRPMNAKAVYERFCPEGGTIYDFCCVDDETEFFNGKEWKSLADYTEGDRVLQYNEDGTAELVNPIEYIHYQNDKPFYVHDIDMMCNFALTGNHDVVYRDDNGNLAKIKVDEMLDKMSKDRGYKLNVPMTAVLKDNKYSVYLEKGFILDLVLDMRNNNLNSESKFISVNKDKGYVTLSDEVFSLCKESREILLKLLVGSPSSGCIAYIGKKEQLYPIQALWNLTFTKMLTMDEYMEGTTNGSHLAYLHTDNFADYEDCDLYYGFDYSEKHRVFNNLKMSFKRDKYCFVVPSHMLVLRRGKGILITGNCGFGGRLLGALSSKKNFKYVGTDPNTETMYHLHQLANYIEQVTGRQDSYELHCCGSEVFKGKPNSIDFAFSSPPYFDLEIYSDEPTQCYNKFPKLEDWLEGYVRQTIKNISYMLKPGRFYAVNIADFTVGKDGKVAYVDEWIKISTEEGMPLYDTVYLGVTARAGSAEQAAGELKKENILIFKKA